ncbi:MAG TPA: ribose-5-phosphate isomerase A [Stellaceae bacterium]|nr:ribose-5-phosphate isomerase A [Stellaceae bacterium]
MHPPASIFKHPIRLMLTVGRDSRYVVHCCFGDGGRLGAAAVRRTPSRALPNCRGADQVERGTLNLIMGLGGALLHEKIVASASDPMIDDDETKPVVRLGRSKLLSVETIFFGGKRRSISCRCGAVSRDCA